MDLVTLSTCYTFKLDLLTIKKIEARDKENVKYGQKALHQIVDEYKGFKGLVWGFYYDSDLGNNIYFTVDDEIDNKATYDEIEKLITDYVV